MLTAELASVRRYKGELRLVPLDGPLRERALELAMGYVAAAEEHVGRTRDELDEALAAAEGELDGPRERRLADGLRKLVEDRCEFDGGEGEEAEALRGELFLAAAAARRALGEGERFERQGLVEAAARARGLSVEELERLLYSDLRGAHRLRALRRISPRALVDGYDLAQAQAVLLRAVRVVAEVRCRAPGAYRALFHKLKFLRLLHAIEAVAANDEAPAGYRITIDGPLSLFESVTKYGLQLALALPAIAACASWSLDAELRWGKARESLRFRLRGADEAVVSEAAAIAAEEGGGAARLSDEVAVLLDELRALDSGWKVEPAREILELPGVGLCVPDLRFEQGKRVVHVEVLGYWSREAVWRRVELCERGLRERVVFAVGRHLRVGEAALDDELPGALYVYKRTMRAKEVLARVEQVAARPAPRGRRRWAAEP